MKSREDYFQLANFEPMVEINGKTTGRKFLLRKFTYGVLVPDQSHPLSTVSVSNSSLSIDLWTGCSWQCRYCHVQGTFQELNEDLVMSKRPEKRNIFMVDQIIDELVKHPYFFPDETIISIGTSSTEPFAPGKVTDSTFEIMNAFIRRGLRNPFWIVTKFGVPKGRKEDIARITKYSRGLMISLCWADNPATIEPVQNNRFINSEEAKEAGAIVTWYMRPIVPEWSGSLSTIEKMMVWVKKNYGHVIDMIIPGGLRWTEGIENGLVEIHKLPMPDIPKADNIKSLPQDIVDLIFSLGKEHFPNVPIFIKSSCALSHMLKVPNIISVQIFDKPDCDLSTCPLAQRQICARSRAFNITVNEAQNILDKLSIPARVISWDCQKGLSTSPDIHSFTYAIRQTLFKYIASEMRQELKPE